MKTLLYFESAVNNYRQSNFLEAKTKFQEVLKVNPADQAVHLYLARIENLLNQAETRENWSGVWTFDNK